MLLSESTIQGSEQWPDASLRIRLRPLETLAERKHDKRLKVLLEHRVLGLPVVITQKGIAAEAVGCIIVSRKREAKQVCCEPSEVQPWIGPPARLEAIKIELAIDAVADAIPAQSAVNRRQNLRATAGRSLLDPFNGVAEAIHQFRASGQSLEHCLGAHEHLPALRAIGVY